MNELPTTLRYCVVGPGRLGSTLLAALPAVGCVVSSVGVREGAARPQAKPPRLPLKDAIARTDVLWLAVPDDAIHAVAENAAAILRAAPPRPALTPLYALHSSGLGSLALLEPLRAAGAQVLCIHPLQTFAGDTVTTRGAALLQDVPAAVTASDERASEFGEALAQALGMRPFRLADEAKPLYHLAATLACNLFVALEGEASKLMDEATHGHDGLAILGPLLQTTLTNLRATGPAQALTGPVARGDVGTVRSHLELLDARSARLSAAYRSLSRTALALAAPRLDDESVRALQALLEGNAL
ncbi:MAG: Rossmann-like and DUF2520 domain-containing protein [Thermoleophilia bacterium]